jgi:RimJ/RimL family protein N-acetyltransferase
MRDVLRTKRLVLRPLQADDIDRVMALFADWAVVQWLSSPPWPYTREHAEDFMHRLEKPDADDRETSFAIAQDDGLIGGIGVRTRPASHLQRGPGPHIGYWLGQPYWGHGYMTEALAGLVRHFFATQPDDAIYCGAFTGNAASLRIQEKLGFVRYGETMLYSNARGGEFPHINTVLTRANFESLREARA